MCPALFVQRCRAGPSIQDKKSNLCTPYCTPFVVHVQSKKSDYDDGTRLPLSRRLGFSSDRNITKRLCYPVWSCCWHVGTRTVLPNLHDAIFACHLKWSHLFYQPCAGRCFHILFYKTTKTLQREVFTQQYSLTDYECDPIRMLKEISLRIFLFFSLLFDFIFDFILRFFYKFPVVRLRSVHKPGSQAAT